MSTSQNYGSKYWAITKEGDTLFLSADTIEVMPNGCLVAWGGFRVDDGEVLERIPVYGIAAGKWDTFYAASALDCRMLCAEEGA